MLLAHNAYAHPGFGDTFTNRTGFEIVVYEAVDGAGQTGRSKKPHKAVAINWERFISTAFQWLILNTRKLILLSPRPGFALAAARRHPPARCNAVILKQLLYKRN